MVFLDFTLGSLELPFANPYARERDHRAADGGLRRAWTSGTTYEFYTSDTDALEAALQANGNLDYSRAA